jgi:hypothetical protein
MSNTSHDHPATPSSATALPDYLQKVQDMASDLHALVKAADLLHDRPKASDLCGAVLVLAVAQARAVSDALDIVNLPPLPR